MSPAYTFSLPYTAFDLDLIGVSPTEIGGAEFSEKVSQFFSAQFAKFGGKARVVLNDTEQLIQVTWTKDLGFKDPIQRALDLCQSGKIAEAIPLLWTLHREQPRDIDILYNLGVAYSELGQYQKAIRILHQLIDVDPLHVHGLVALGVASIKLMDLQSAEVFLRRALTLEPRNHWALKNLGACLLKCDKPAEAVGVFEAAIEANPGDAQSILGLGQAFEQSDRVQEADEQYIKLIKMGSPLHLVDVAKQRRTEIGQKTRRSRGSSRPDVFMYITSALERFQGMTKSQIQAIGVEIAILGQRGLDINDPERKYSLKTLPGQFCGLHLCSIMYTAFKQFAPTEDVGIDFSKEYEAATLAGPR